MTLQQQQRVVRSHYGLRRVVTPDEVAEEIASLKRKLQKGTLDDSSEYLAARLGLLDTPA